MKKLYILLVVILITTFSFGQLVINEIDADQLSVDTAEFIELKGAANMPLDGYVVVLFNGNDGKSYKAYDLDGKTTDANGFFILADTALASGTADIDMGADSNLQNGADAVAIYQANATDFPNDTPLTTTNLIDALVYDTNDDDDDGLLSGLNETVQYNEDENDASQTESIQRKDDGTYEIKTPTFRQENDAAASVQSNNIKGFSMYPNPTNGNIVNIITSQNLAKNIQIFNILGKQVLTKRIIGTTVNVAHLNSGIYLVKVEEAGNVVTRKLIIN